MPLFVEELVAAALETGQVDPVASPSGVAGGHGVPSALYDSLMLRLERLGEAKAVAQLASVIGRSFSHQLLTAVAPESGNALEAALARLLESGLIRLEHNDDEKVYSFKHALVRDVAYHSLLNRQRRELHARVADAIEIHRPEIASREPDYLAQHLSEAGRTSRAVQMWLEAAKQSAERSANLEANAQLRRAREEIKKLPAGVERDNLELNIQIALIGPTIALQGFGAVAVADVSSRAIELCRALDNDPRIFPALYARWSYLRVASNVREAGALAQDFLTLAEQRGPGLIAWSGIACSARRYSTGRQQRRASILRGRPSFTMRPPTGRRPSSMALTCRSRAYRTYASSTGYWAGLPKP